MPPKKSTNGGGGASPSDDLPLGSLTDGEMKFIKVMFDNMTQKPETNWDQVAIDLGLKDAKCAKERFRQMSVKHSWNPSKPRKKPGSSNTNATTLSKVAKPKTSRKTVGRKTKVKAEAEADDDDDDAELSDVKDGSDEDGQLEEPASA